MKIIETGQGQEATVEWTCPSCKAQQTDSVHPRYGPFISSTCSECGKTFCDEQLTFADVARWDEARDWAETQDAHHDD